MMLPNLQKMVLMMTLILAGCRGEFAPTGAGGDTGQAPVMVFASGPESGVTQAGLQICRDRKGWAQLWSRHLGPDAENTPLPVVCFATENVVGVFLGKRPTGGYSLSVGSLEKGRDGWLLRTREVAPGEDAPIELAESHPFAFVIVPRHVGEIDWAPRP
ncbi:MAG: protease complex subunit PrcB family protein [Planctomycetes bacterium]|nr:protease complex subunit PrcB family protein [Planctomycetota bacterium]